ncbi:MAG: hypothetical protein AAGF07_02165 [Patescibacteria group bacterium]
MSNGNIEDRITSAVGKFIKVLSLYYNKYGFIDSIPYYKVKNDAEFLQFVDAERTFIQVIVDTCHEIDIPVYRCIRVEQQDEIDFQYLKVMPKESVSSDLLKFTEKKVKFLSSDLLYMISDRLESENLAYKLTELQLYYWTRKTLK